jgi:WD40 repeat protein
MHCEIKEVHRIDSHKGPIYSLAVQEDEIFTGGSDRLLLKHTVKNPDEGVLLASFGESIFSICKTERQILVGGFLGHLYQIQLDTSIVKKWEAHEGSIFSIVDIPNDRLATAAADGKVHIWDSKKMEIIRTIWLGEFKIRKLYFHQASNQLAVACGNGVLTILDLVWFNTLDEWNDPNNPCLSIAYYEEKKLWTTGHKNGVIHFWMQNHEGPVFSLQAHQGPVYDLKVDDNLGLLISCSQDKSLKIWRIRDMELQVKWDNMGGSPYRSINQIHFQDGRLTVVGDNSKIDLLKICFFE